MSENLNKNINTPKKTKKKKKIKASKIALLIANIIIGLTILGGITGLAVVLFFVSDKPEVKLDDFNSQQSSQIFDENGNLIADVGETIRTNITYDELPTSLIDAFVAVEDSRFFEHNGFDIPRFVRAMFNNLISMSLAEGGSTFTMQLIDNVYFIDTANEVSTLESIKRKFQEIFLAMDVEQILSKERILELYLNKINFGGYGNSRGVQQASQFYFNKDVSELTISESALLAGVINAPTLYNPFNYLDYATERRDTVLYLMNYHGYITDLEYELALAVKVEDLLVDPYDRDEDSAGEGNPYQAYIDVVIAEAKEITGYDPTVVPMRIYTYMNEDVQTQIDKIQAGDVEEFEYPDSSIEMAVVSYNNHTGAVNGIGGGRHYADGGSLLLNYATDQLKQPGSTVKPFLSYALAFENLGWATSHVVTDKPINYRGTNIVIRNATGKYYGDVTLEYAFSNSLNTPALQTLQEVIDVQNTAYVVQYLNSMGFDQVTIDNFDLGYGIGGSTFEVTVEQLAAAMATMLNGGVYIEPHTISKIEFIDSTEVYEPQYTPTTVISEQSAYMVSELMYDAVYGPYYNYMQVLEEDYPVYAKTGTTDWGTSGVEYGIPVGAAKDIWMVGGTSEYTVATWYGYPKAESDVDTWISYEKNSPNVRGHITNLVLDANHIDNEPEAIPRPSGLVNITHVLGLYPYTATIENMDSKFVTTGLIKSENASLQDPSQVQIDPLTDLAVTIDALGNTNIKFPDYPDASKLSVAPEDKDVSLSVGSIYVEAYGTRIFDWSWVYGPIRYKAEIKLNGEVVHNLTSENSSIDQLVTYKPGDYIEVCGKYSYENVDVASNVVCKAFEVEDNDQSITFLGANATKEEIVAFATANKLILTYSEIASDSPNKNGIFMNVPDATGALVRTQVNSQTLTMKQSEWLTQNIEVEIYYQCPANSTIVGNGCVCDTGFDETPEGSCVAKPTTTPEVTVSPETTPEVSPAP